MGWQRGRGGLGRWARRADGDGYGHRRDDDHNDDARRNPPATIDAGFEGILVRDNPTLTKEGSGDLFGRLHPPITETGFFSAMNALFRVVAGSFRGFHPMIMARSTSPPR